nr:spore coat protein GerQ [Paenibacillus taiwanensis]
MAYTHYPVHPVHPVQPVHPAFSSAQARNGSYGGGMLPMPYGQPVGGVGSVPFAQPQPGFTQQTMVPPQVPSGGFMTPTGAVLPNTNFEQSYVENILRLNLGKVGTFYMTYENNSEWNAKIFRGVVEAAGRDHIIISDPMTGQRIILLMVNLDYVTFDEPLVYQYPGVTGNTGREEEA